MNKKYLLPILSLLLIFYEIYGTDVKGGTHVTLPTFTTKTGAAITASAVGGWSMKTAEVDNLDSWSVPSISGNSARTIYISTTSSKFNVIMRGDLTPPDSDGEITGPTDYSIEAVFNGELYIDPTVLTLADGDAAKTLTAKMNGVTYGSNWMIKSGDSSSNSWTGHEIIGEESVTIGKNGNWAPPAGIYTVTAVDPTNSNNVAEIEIVVLKITIKNGDTDITDKIQNEIVGRKVSLSATVFPSVGTVSKNKWTIPGVRVKNFIATNTSANLTELPTSDLEKDSVTYYWVDGEDNREVKYSFELNSQIFEKKVKFNVKRPIATLESKFGSVQIVYANAVKDYNFIMGLFTGSNGPGIILKSSITDPPGFNKGEGQFWQEIIYSHTNFFAAGHDVIVQKRLDAPLPYATLPNSLQDSPIVRLDERFSKISRIDSFRTWVMYRPAGDDTIWVPLLSAQWYFNGTAEKKNGKWTLISGDQGLRINQNTTDFPSWCN